MLSASVLDVGSETVFHVAARSVERFDVINTMRTTGIGILARE
jgi:hypothetical protein